MSDYPENAEAISRDDAMAAAKALRVMASWSEADLAKRLTLVADALDTADNIEID